jgi:FkbM family methyltransferase
MKAVINLARFFANHPLTRDAPIRAWARFASWQLKSRIQDEIIFPWIEGQRLVIRHGMTGATGNIYVGLHEFVDMMLLLHFLRESDLFLDIGANVGSYVVLASGVCRARTWAFEPDPDTVRQLKRNISVNSLDEMVTVSECALGATRAEVPFTIGLDTMNKVAVASDKNVRKVRQERLDTLVSGALPVMIKIDVEGYEEDVLRGAKSLIANPSLKVIELETVTPWIAGILLSNQFERAYYDPFRRELGREPNDLGSSNFLFVRDWPFVVTRLVTAKRVEILGRRI